MVLQNPTCPRPADAVEMSELRALFLDSGGEDD